MDISTILNILNSADMHFLLYFGTVLTVFIAFYYLASKKQAKMIDKINESLNYQQKANQQSNLVVAELRRSNRYLADLANVQPMEYSEKEMDASTLSQPSAMGAPAANNSQYKLYVGNIDYTATESELASYFSQYGQVEFVNIPVNRYTGKARGFGFVSFGSQSDAERAMALHGSEFKGRQIQVNFAKERELA